MNAIVKLQVNDAKLIPGLARAFTTKYSYLAELMQNGRRAGASLLEIRYSAVQDPEGNWPGTLVFQDNGSGIQDWQNLLSVADSGWDEAIQAKEQPFGIGFFACVSAAQKVRVESGDMVLDFTRKAALDFEELEVRDNAEQVQGTRITLTGIDCPEFELANAMQRYARGFPVPVLYNGQELERPHSEEALRASEGKFEEVVSLPGIGTVAIHPYHTGYGSIRAYLLGICVTEGHGSLEYATVHLDPQLFPARLPDRDKLIDQDEQMRKVTEAVDAWWIGRFKEMKEQWSPAQLWKQHPAIFTKMLKIGLLNDVDSVPGELFWKVHPVCFYEPEQREWNCAELGFVTRQQVIDREVMLCKNLPSYSGDGGTVAQTVAHLLKWLEVTSDSFHKEHWAATHAIDLVGEYSEPTEDQGTVRFESQGNGKAFVGRVDLEVHVTDEMTLEWQGHTVTTSAAAVIEFEQEGDVARMVVAGPYDSREVTAMVDSFLGDFDVGDDDMFERETFELSQLIDSLKKVPAATSLQYCVEGRPYKELANTQNTAVLVVNTQGAQLSFVDGNPLLEALQLYRAGNTDARMLKHLLTPMLMQMATSEAEKEQSMLSRTVMNVVYSHASCEQVTGIALSSDQVCDRLRDMFRDRAVNVKDWAALRTEIEDAVPAVVAEVLANPTTE